MKHTTEELIFAAHVRQLARAIFKLDLDNASDAWLSEHPLAPFPSDADSFVQEGWDRRKAERIAAHGTYTRQWQEEHPINSYIPAALKRIDEAASIIKDLRQL